MLLRDLALELSESRNLVLELVLLGLGLIGSSVGGSLRAILVGGVLASLLLLSLVGGVGNVLATGLSLVLDVGRLVLGLLLCLLCLLLLLGETSVGDGLRVVASLTVGADPLVRRGGLVDVVQLVLGGTSEVRSLCCRISGDVASENANVLEKLTSLRVGEDELRSERKRPVCEYRSLWQRRTTNSKQTYLSKSAEVSDGVLAVALSLILVDARSDLLEVDLGLQEKV